MLISKLHNWYLALQHIRLHVEGTSWILSLSCPFFVINNYSNYNRITTGLHSKFRRLHDDKIVILVTSPKWKKERYLYFLNFELPIICQIVMGIWFHLYLQDFMILHFHNYLLSRTLVFKSLGISWILIEFHCT